MYNKLETSQPRTVVITRSERPVVVSRAFFNQETKQPKAVQSFIVNVDPVEKSKICDSNGCGDSFVGGFLAKLALIDENMVKEQK